MKRVALLIMVLSVLLGGCDTYAIFGMYPSDRADSWYCETLDFTLNVDQTVSVLNWEGKTLNIRMAVQSSYYVMFHEQEKDAVTQNSVLFSGTYSYSGENLILKIEEDNLFNGAYEELCFVPVE